MKIVEKLIRWASGFMVRCCRGVRLAPLEDMLFGLKKRPAARAEAARSWC